MALDLLHKVFNHMGKSCPVRNVEEMNDWFVCTLKDMCCPSQEAMQLHNQGYYEDETGQKVFSVMPPEPVYFHGTDMQGALNILSDKAFKVLVPHHPIGIYSYCSESVSEVSCYTAQGWEFAFSSFGVVMSIKASKIIDAVGPGQIARMVRSQARRTGRASGCEHIHHPQGVCIHTCRFHRSAWQALLSSASSPAVQLQVPTATMGYWGKKWQGQGDDDKQWQKEEKKDTNKLEQKLCDFVDKATEFLAKAVGTPVGTPVITIGKSSGPAWGTGGSSSSTGEHGPVELWSAAAAAAAGFPPPPPGVPPVEGKVWNSQEHTWAQPPLVPNAERYEGQYAPVAKAKGQPPGGWFNIPRELTLCAGAGQLLIQGMLGIQQSKCRFCWSCYSQSWFRPGNCCIWGNCPHFGFATTITSLLGDPEYATYHAAIVQKFVEEEIEPNARLGFDFDGFDYYNLAVPPPKILDEKLQARAVMVPAVHEHPMNFSSDAKMGFSKAPPPGKGKNKGKPEADAKAKVAAKNPIAKAKAKVAAKDKAKAIAKPAAKGKAKDKNVSKFNVSP